METADFTARWVNSEAAERTNAQPFLVELCDLLGVQRPDPATGGVGPYQFERHVTHHHEDDRATIRRIDLYKRGCFILEAKQGANVVLQPELFATQSESVRRQAVRQSPGWQRHMQQAKGQAEGYVRDLSPGEPSPPFLIVCDVGFCFDVYADFSGTGRHYAQFPDRESFRIHLGDLASADVRTRLRTVWTDPAALDPARRRTRVTRDIAGQLAVLARALEARHAPDTVAQFLMRCVFSMFAQSVNLLPTPTAFTDLLRRCHANPDTFAYSVADLWRAMNAGDISVALNARLRRFNGGLFAPGAEPLCLSADEINQLIIAAGRDWADVEPAIFGTLLENALDTRQRGQLGAHFTPRSFVERLVLPAVMAPLRAQWDGVVATADEKLRAGDRKAAATALRDFHHQLCAVRVLDPACGSGNFLYVTMELMKRLEGEVLDALANLLPGEGDRLAMQGETVGPRQFFGLEKNPRAVPVAELVLWIGALQWHFRTVGRAPPAEPILGDFHNIAETDALLTSDGEEIVRGKDGVPLSRWDGVTTKLHPVTGEKVPDETARREVTRPIKPRMTRWPAAEFIVGNPPFIGAKYMRAELGEGYVEALWRTYCKVPPSADLAMFFWWKAADALAEAKTTVRRFGFITSNSIRQTFCRRVVATAMTGKRRLRLVYAIPDHPWADGTGTAAVRIAMTVAERIIRDMPDAHLARVTDEAFSGDGEPKVMIVTATTLINADLSEGTDIDVASALRSNEGLAHRGVQVFGAGFIVTSSQAKTLGLERYTLLKEKIRPYINGRDLTQRSRGAMVIDLFGLNEAEVRAAFPDVFQRLVNHVKPSRDENARQSYRTQWWIHGEPRVELRGALDGLLRFVATVATSKHRFFCFLPVTVLPDDALINIASDDAFHLGVLSSRFHVAWALAAGGRLGIGNDPRYNKTRCFDPFPFPLPTSAQRARIAALAEELDTLRRTRIDAHPHLTMTGLYNVLEQLRTNTPLSSAERDLHDTGQVSVLRDLHEKLDAAVAEAYGWPADLPAAEIVARVVALNRERRAEEVAGIVHWLRPAFQAGAPVTRAQAALAVEEGGDTARTPWPAKDPERFVALRATLAAAPGAPADLSRRFDRATTARIRAMLETLAALGQAQRGADGRYRA